MQLPNNNMYFVNRGFKFFNPGLLIIANLLSLQIMAFPRSDTEDIDTIKPKVYSVAGIFKPAGNTAYYSVTFYQSARYYKLMLKNKNYITSLRILKQSKKTNQPVEVYLTDNYGDIIDRVIKIK